MLQSQTARIRIPALIQLNRASVSLSERIIRLISQNCSENTCIDRAPRKRKHLPNANFITTTMITITCSFRKLLTTYERIPLKPSASERLGPPLPGRTPEGRQSVDDASRADPVAPFSHPQNGKGRLVHFFPGVTQHSGAGKTMPPAARKSARKQSLCTERRLRPSLAHLHSYICTIGRSWARRSPPSALVTKAGGAAQSMRSQPPPGLAGTWARPRCLPGHDAPQTSVSR